MNELEAPDSKRGTHFLVILVACYTVSFVGAEGVLRGLQDWYPYVVKPVWAPPGSLLVPIWTVLYGTIAVAAWQVWESASRRRSLAITCLCVQGALGALWPWLFFSLRSLPIATFEGSATWLITGATIWAFSRVKTSAALLLVPYWIWVAFLTALAFALSRSGH